jgi:hypothetical protein
LLALTSSECEVEAHVIDAERNRRHIGWGNPETIDEDKNNLDLAIAGYLQSINEDHSGRDMLEEHREESEIDQQAVSRGERPWPSGIGRNTKTLPGTQRCDIE